MALTLVVVWKIIEEMKGSLYALVLGALCVVFSPLLRLNGLFQPNSFDVLAWTAVYYFLIKYLSTEQAKWLYWGAVCLALGILNKYNIVFLLPGLLAALLLSPQRKIIMRKEFYGAACWLS
ncbi:MAG: glycosyltransferase family 39 protein [Leadbetterella sp.]|nr:glycosyltransferase family 39 protein [Leadbetterella sp.]